jgi:hypothetical protein
MRALTTAIVYLGTFLAIGVVAKAVAGLQMSRRGVDLADVHEQAGSNRRRRVFLLGLWRNEGPD